MGADWDRAEPACRRFDVTNVKRSPRRSSAPDGSKRSGVSACFFDADHLSGSGGELFVVRNRLDLIAANDFHHLDARDDGLVWERAVSQTGEYAIAARCPI